MNMLVVTCETKNEKFVLEEHYLVLLGYGKRRRKKFKIIVPSVYRDIPRKITEHA